MRLDHLLSKENRVFVLSLGGCWLAPGGGKFLSLFGVWFGREVVASFCFQVKTGTVHISCVWFWESMKQELFAVFQPLLVVKGFAE